MPSFKQSLLKKQLRESRLAHKAPFTPLNDYEIYLINRHTDTFVLFELINLVQRTRFFTIDTESDIFSNRPALIQVELIDPIVSRVLLIEVCHLPLDRQSLTFWYIRSLMKFILRPSNHIFTWSNGKQELRSFVSYGLFEAELIDALDIEDIQQEFKCWFDQSDRVDSVHRPIWGLQSAVVELFDEYLEKGETFNQWSRGLHLPPASSHSNHRSKIEAMIKYATNDCLSVTKVAYAIGRLHVFQFPSDF